ncbi:hypothetical protein BFJ69_g3613 [Fusarium oxysporum]|uniref:Uncharacterized protein n=1 Tax=Fusarium oxysporum TaxID=5507 RepID=A0A420NN80_FUSOX|nr:hypothetical protein BFJ69_g3613 [Fusarium oxysporum]
MLGLSIAETDQKLDLRPMDTLSIIVFVKPVNALCVKVE